MSGVRRLPYVDMLRQLAPKEGERVGITGSVGAGAGTQGGDTRGARPDSGSYTGNCSRADRHSAYPVTIRAMDLAGVGATTTLGATPASQGHFYSFLSGPSRAARGLPLLVMDDSVRTSLSAQAQRVTVARHRPRDPELGNLLGRGVTRVPIFGSARPRSLLPNPPPTPIDAGNAQRAQQQGTGGAGTTAAIANVYANVSQRPVPPSKPRPADSGRGRGRGSTVVQLYRRR